MSLSLGTNLGVSKYVSLNKVKNNTYEEKISSICMDLLESSYSIYDNLTKLKKIENLEFNSTDLVTDNSKNFIDEHIFTEYGIKEIYDYLINDSIVKSVYKVECFTLGNIIIIPRIKTNYFVVIKKEKMSIGKFIKKQKMVYTIVLIVKYDYSDFRYSPYNTYENKKYCYISNTDFLFSEDYEKFLLALEIYNQQLNKSILEYDEEKTRLILDKNKAIDAIINIHNDVKSIIKELQ